MPPFRWLRWVRASFVIAGTSLLIASSLQAEPIDETKVQRTLLQRFDENRNDKLDSGEARQARARLKNLMEDKSEREINIQTWRDDVRDLLQTIDQDGDNRLSVAERDAGRQMLEGLIPKVDSQVPRDRETSGSSASRERVSDSATRFNRASSGGYGSGSRGSGGRSFGSAMGGGGFGNSGGGSFMSGNGFAGGGAGFSSGGGRETFTGGSTGFADAGATGSDGAISGASSGSETTSGGTNNIRPGMGDPGSGFSSNGFGGKPPAEFGTGRPEVSGTGGTESGAPKGSADIGTFAPSQEPLGDTPLKPPATPDASKPAMPMPGDAAKPPSDSTGGKPGTPPTEAKPGEMPPGSLPIAPPDSLGGGMDSPTIDGPPADGPGGTTIVPFNPMPNF